MFAGLIELCHFRFAIEQYYINVGPLVPEYGLNCAGSAACRAITGISEHPEHELVRFLFRNSSDSKIA